jgi:hypothetical protein
MLSFDTCEKIGDSTHVTEHGRNRKSGSICYLAGVVDVMWLRIRKRYHFKQAIGCSSEPINGSLVRRMMSSETSGEEVGCLCEGYSHLRQPSTTCPLPMK